jgi:hypothetical protein
METTRYIDPLQFCPECGIRIEKNYPLHNDCILWGIFIHKYKSKDDWIVACIKNGERVNAIMKFH